jgi:hypothetical protein
LQRAHTHRTRWPPLSTPRHPSSLRFSRGKRASTSHPRPLRPHRPVTAPPPPAATPTTTPPPLRLVTASTRTPSSSTLPPTCPSPRRSENSPRPTTFTDPWTSPRSSRRSSPTPIRRPTNDPRKTQRTGMMTTVPRRRTTSSTSQRQRATIHMDHKARSHPTHQRGSQHSRYHQRARSRTTRCIPPRPPCTPRPIPYMSSRLTSTARCLRSEAACAMSQHHTTRTARADLLTHSP